MEMSIKKERLLWNNDVIILQYSTNRHGCQRTFYKDGRKNYAIIIIKINQSTESSLLGKSNVILAWWHKINLIKAMFNNKILKY